MSINIDPVLQKTLDGLGLNEKESAVYCFLLQRGESSAITVSRGVELHRQFVYNALHSLGEKGLVAQTGTTRSKWRANNPRRFIAIAEEKQLLAIRAVDGLLALAHQKEGQEFEVIEGVQAYRARLLNTVIEMPRESVVCLVCGEWNRYFELAGEKGHEAWERARLSKGITFRVIGPSSLAKAIEGSARNDMEYRTLKHLDQNLVNTVIYSDRVDFDIYGEPHVTFTIKNPEIAASQRRFFDLLWSVAQERF